MSHEHDKGGSGGNLKIAFFLNLAFTIIEFLGGLWTNSIAIMTDALHDLGDCASLGLAWYFDRLSNRDRTPRHTYGYARYRLLGGLLTGVVLAAGLTFVLWKAIGRLRSPEEVKAPGMVLLALVGIAFNGAAALRVRKGTSLTERVVSWHLLEDTFGWAAVLVGGGVMTFWDVPWVDPLLSIGISLVVLWNVGRNLKRIARVFLQTAPESFEVERFEDGVRRLPGVLATLHTHTWSLDGERHVLTTHIVMRAGTHRAGLLDAKRAVHRMLDGEFMHVTIEVDLEGEEPSPGP